MKRFIQDAIINTGLFLAKKATQKQEGGILQQKSHPAEQAPSASWTSIKTRANRMAGFVPLIVWGALFLLMLFADSPGTDTTKIGVIAKCAFVGIFVSALLICFSFSKVMPVRIDAILMLFLFVAAFFMGEAGLMVVRGFLIFQIGMLLFVIIKLLYCLGNRVLGNEDSL